MWKTCTMLGLTMATMLASPASAETLRMIAGWSESNAMAYMPGAQFKKNLEAQDVGLDVEILGPETVPPFEQVGPASAGVFDIIYTHAAYHDKAITNATSAMEPDMDIMRSSGIFDAMDAHLQETHNLKLLANTSVGRTGFHCYLSEPLSEDGDWKGRKIRGVSTFAAVIEALGGVPVQTSMGEVYSGIERGVVDGACAPQSVYRGTKHYEVAPYRTEPTFGQNVGYIAMNLDAWNSLSDAEKEAVRQAGIQTEKDTIRIGDEVIASDLEALSEDGVEVTEFTEESFEDVRNAYQQGTWQLVADCCGEDNAREIHEMAIEAGLAE